MLEIPNNTKHEEMMDFKKFAQSIKGLMYNDEKIFIEGTFKEKKTKKIISGDNFLANKVWKSGEKINLELIYKTYLEWFNRTSHYGEEEREFISVKLGEVKE